MTGTIPAELGSLTNLRWLLLWENRLSGSIPAELGSLTNLRHMILSNNQLSGSIPAELGGLTDLTQLRIGGNQLTGSIPPELGSLTNLIWLHLDGNQLTGSIPAELGSLTNLEELYLHGNQLTGTIPAELGNLTSLELFYLDGNQLSGSIPAELGNLTSVGDLFLYGNQLTGSIPPELGNLTNVEFLNLGGNQLSGSIPPELGNLTNLGGIVVSHNRLSGSIPPELGSITGLAGLDLAGNQLTGSIPVELGSITGLAGLDLHGNQLSGGIPAELGSLANLRRLYLHGNQLTGSIPAELGSLTNLRGLYLHGNQLTGGIPPELSSLTNLIDLYLGANRLEGCISQGLEGVPSNDLSSLRLPFCGSGGAPTISTLIIPGDESLTVTWAVPFSNGGAAITAYDLRYIRSDADKTVDANWTVAEDVRTGMGVLQYVLTGLAAGTQYDIQVRAVRGTEDGPWSAAATGIPAAWGATRFLSQEFVGPGDEVQVTITAAGYGRSGEIVEFLPPGFRYASGSLPENSIKATNSAVIFSLMGERAFTYTLIAPSRAGSYSFLPNVIRNEDRKSRRIGGVSVITVQDSVSVYATASTEVLVRIDSTVPVTVTFSEPVSGFTAEDVVTANGVIGNFRGSGTTYYFGVTPKTIGGVTVDIAAGAATDVRGNGNIAAPQLLLGIPYDDDHDGSISRGEAIAAVLDYFAGRISKEQAIAVIILYFSG